MSCEEGPRRMVSHAPKFVCLRNKAVVTQITLELAEFGYLAPKGQFTVTNFDSTLRSVKNFGTSAYDIRSS